MFTNMHSERNFFASNISKYLGDENNVAQGYKVISAPYCDL